MKRILTIITLACLPPAFGIMIASHTMQSVLLARIGLGIFALALVAAATFEITDRFYRGHHA